MPMLRTLILILIRRAKTNLINYVIFFEIIILLKMKIQSVEI